MSTTQHDFVATEYAPRAADYVTSINHSTGDDLDQIDTVLRGRHLAGGLRRVLDLGCGGGHVAYRAAAHATEVVAYDLTADMLDVVKATAAAKGLSNIALQQGAAERLPFADASFDAVLCRFSTHHWQDWEAGLREARRVLKPQGIAVFIDGISPANPVLDTHLQTIEVLRDASHVRNYSVAEWVGALSRARLDITSMTLRRLPLDFPVWTARTRTPALKADAIRAVQASAPPAVRDHFAMTPDGGFELDVMTVTLKPASL